MPYKISKVRVIGNFQPFLGQEAWDSDSAPNLQRISDQRNSWSYTTPVELPELHYDYAYIVTYEDGSQQTIDQQRDCYATTEYYCY